MGVSEISMALGQWSLRLRPDTPRSVLDALGYFGHVAITTGRVQPQLLGDSLLRSARYVGVLTGVTRTDTTAPVNISGPGMAFWLGDANDKGAVYETPVALTAATFAASITALLPSSGAVTAGTIGSVPGTLTQSYVWTSPRTAITSVCALMGGTGTAAAEWRVNGDATLDAGTVASLYVTTPVAALVRKNTGADQAMRAMHGVMQNAGDVNDYTTRAVVLAAGSSGSTAVGSANAATVPYKDLHGNAVKLTRMASQSSTDPVNANAAAAGVLALYNAPRNAIQLSSDEFDLRGTIAVGDYVWVQDPDSGLVDYTQEIRLRGEILTPVLMRVVELDWPVLAGYGAAYRDVNGAWLDLTDYLLFETGSTNVVVGSTNRPLTGSGEPVGSRPIPDATVPATPVFGAFATSSYIGTSDGATKAQIQANWSVPLNADGSTITDGDHYEVRYRPDLSAAQPNPTYAQLAAGGYTYNSLAALAGTYNQLIPVTTTSQWKVTFVAWGTNTVLIQELTPGVTYDFQVRAVDTASPPNQSVWSATTTVQAAADTIAPPAPDAPTVAANMASVQVTWDCGQASGGTFNQASDLHHIEVHGSYDPLFAVSTATKLGNLPASIANITGQIPVVGSFTIPPGQPPAQNMYVRVVAVDTTGNKSLPSASAGATAALWSNAYISDLSVSKVTAGTITATWINAGTIATASAGQRCAMDLNGFHAYDSNGSLVFDVNDSTSVLTLGRNGTTSASITLDTSTTYPTIYLNPATGTNNATIQARPFSNNTDVGMIMRTGTFTANGFQSYNQMYMDDLIAVLETVTTGATTPNGGVNNGGFVFADPTQLDVGVDRGSTGNQGWLIWNTDSVSHMGKWASGNTYSGYAATYCGSISAGAGGSSGTITYGATMAGTQCPVITILDQSGAAANWFGLQISNFTSVSVNWAKPNAITVYLWDFRI